MTMEMLNEFLDAIARGTLIGIGASFWLFAIVAIWKWFLGIAKSFLHWCFPNRFKSKTEESEDE